MSTTEILVGLAGVLGSMIVAYLAYNRGIKADNDAAEDKAISQVYAGYGGLLLQIQNDNKYIRNELIELRKEVDECKEREDQLRNLLNLKGAN